MANGFASGFQVGQQQGPFDLLIEQISKSQDRRAKEEATLKQTLQTMGLQQQIDRQESEAKQKQELARIAARGEERRRTQAEKPSSIKQQAFESVAKGIPLPGFSLKETKRLAGAGQQGFTLDTSFLKDVEEAAKKQKGQELPPGVTEDDIKFTMKKRGMTREQVLEALRNR